MSEQFDASLIHASLIHDDIHGDPLSAEIVAEHKRTVDHLMKMPNALANAKLHAENDMQRRVNACNRIAWGGAPADMRAPTAEEAAALLERLSAEDREKLLRDAGLAAVQRNLLAGMAAAQEEYHSHLQAEKDALAQHHEEAEEWAAFEAHDAAGQGARFAAWRAARER